MQPARPCLHFQSEASGPPFLSDHPARRRELHRRDQAAVAAVAAGIANHVLIPIGRNGYFGSRIGNRVQQLPQFRTIGEFEMPLGAMAPAQLYAHMARRHIELYGTRSENFGKIAVNARRHATLNDNALMREP